MKYQTKQKQFEVDALQWTEENVQEMAVFLDVLHWGTVIISIKGMLEASEGDYIIKTEDEIYSCKKEIFERTYEEVEE